jgi:hypothetical protein
LRRGQRYALFTLTGIAGEEDLDAPDLFLNVRENDPLARTNTGRMNGGSEEQKASAISVTRTKSDGKFPSSSSLLSQEDSSAARDKLIEKIVAIDTPRMLSRGQSGGSESKISLPQRTPKIAGH